MTNADPIGLTFRDVRSMATMRLVMEGEWKGWIVRKHPDGMWVSHRKATEDDLMAIIEAALVYEQAKTEGAAADLGTRGSDDGA